jgi:caa(3)-type oxidase subunit IV
MSDSSTPAAGHAHPSTGSGQAHAHAHPSYFKIWAILSGLLVVSVAGTLLGLNIPTKITVTVAFTIAIIKAYMVARYFMHINLERKYVAYLVGAMLVLMFLMVGAVSPDVMKHEGANWHNTAAEEWVKNGLAHPPAEEGEGAKPEGAAHEGGEHH